MWAEELLGLRLFAFCGRYMVEKCAFPRTAQLRRREPCRSQEPVWNAVIWLDRNRTADRVQRLRGVSGAQTDCGIDSLCEALAGPMFTLSDGPFWQPSYKQSSQGREKTCPITWKGSKAQRNKKFSKLLTPCGQTNCSPTLYLSNIIF